MLSKTKIWHLWECHRMEIIMKVLKVVMIVMAILIATGVGIYLYADSKETDQVEEAVMI